MKSPVAFTRKSPVVVRIPAFIVIVASFVTIVQFLVQGFLPELYKSLGIYIPLIVVNCIILGRAESYASKNPVIPSMFDGIGMGLGFTVALTITGLLREFVGAGTIFGLQILPKSVPVVSIFVKAPGAFLVLAIVVAVLNAANIKTKANKMTEGCDGCCKDCGMDCKAEEGGTKE